MPMDELLAQLRTQGEHETYPTASEADVRHTEEALDVTLPSSFRAFVTQFSNGAYLFMVQEVSAVGSGNAQIGAIRHVVASGVPATPDDTVTTPSGQDVSAASLVPFSIDSNGNCWCFLTSSSGPSNEYPVAYCDTERLRLVGELPSFEAWLEILVREQDEVIRTLDDHRLADELGLG
jgi:SMI1/KNR4 family protein SUKH-1